MADDDAWQILEIGRDDQGDLNMREFVDARLVRAPIIALSLAIVGFIMGLGEAIMRPINAVAEGLATVVGATFGESVLIIAAGARQAAWSIEHGATSLFGPATYPIAIATVMSGLYVLSWFWQRTEWNPFGFLFARFGR